MTELPSEPSPADPDASGRAIRVMIVDDHAMVAESLRRVLDAEPGLTTVAVAGTREAAAAQFASAKPDVVLVDLRLPDGDGIALGRWLRAQSSSVVLLLLTGASTGSVLRGAIEAGFAGVLDKAADVPGLVRAIRRASEGGLTITPDELARLMPDWRNDPNRLSQRESEVLVLVARGYTNQMVADELVISVNTVRKHVQAILTKLQVHSKLEAVVVGRRQGLIGSE